MQIIGGNIQSSSQHRFERTELRLDAARTLTTTSTPAPNNSQQSAEPPQRRSEASESSPPPRIPSPRLDRLRPPVVEEKENLFDQNFSLLRAIVESLTGREIDTLELRGGAPAASAPAEAATAAIAATAIHVRESEITEVAFQGTFNTADGQAIELDLHYRLERHYEATTIAVAANGVRRDPLILNFDGEGVALSPQRTDFDLDSDGAAESIPTLAPGSAYLALDIDGNGNIDNGRELFGPTTDNGYAELARWDSDNNGFIDSGDPVFDQLRLFRPGTELQTLAERDIGAIFLGHVASPARLTDVANQSLGQLRATGFYLTNSGGAGLVQEFDLVV